MKIVGWTHWDDQRFRDHEPETWEECSQREQVIAHELRARGYRFNGYYHQGGEYGVPVFDDGTLFQCTFRTWGGIMAMAYPEEMDHDGNEYTSWAWYNENQRQVLPTYEGLIKVYGFTHAGSDI